MTFLAQWAILIKNLWSSALWYLFVGFCLFMCHPIEHPWLVALGVVFVGTVWFPLLALFVERNR